MWITLQTKKRVGDAIGALNHGDSADNLFAFYYFIGISTSQRDPYSNILAVISKSHHL